MARYNPRALAFVEHFWDEHDMTLDMLEKSSHVQLRLDKLNVTVYHTGQFICIWAHSTQNKSGVVLIG